MSTTNDPDGRSRPKRCWLIWGLVVAVTITMSLAMMELWPYSTREFRGDGQITDSGFWTYPRYHATFAQISLTEPGEYIFRCSGLPPESMTFALQINKKSDYDVLSGLTTIVDVRLSTADGQTVAQASGALHEWVLAWTPACDLGEFWHEQLRDVKVKRNQEYTLRVLVKDVDTNLPPLEVQVTLSGGGNELP